MRGEESFSDPRVRDVFMTWQFMIEDGYFGPEGPPPTLTALRSFDQVQKEEAGMVLSDPFTAADVPTEWRDKFGFFPFPIIDPDLPVGEITPVAGHFIPANAAHPAEALKFLTFMNSAEAQGLISQQNVVSFGFVPAHKAVDTSGFPHNIQTGIAMIEEADYLHQPFFFSIPQSVAGEAVGAMRQFLLDFDDVDRSLEMLDEIQQALNES